MGAPARGLHHTPTKRRGSNNPTRKEDGDSSEQASRILYTGRRSDAAQVGGPRQDQCLGGERTRRKQPTGQVSQPDDYSLLFVFAVNDDDARPVLLFVSNG